MYRNILWIIVFLATFGLPLEAQGSGLSDDVFFTRELCPPGADTDECEVVSVFRLENQPYSIAIVENYMFRSSSFGIAQRKPQGWELISAGPLMDLEVMAYSPADPFSYENYPNVLLEIPPRVLFDLLEIISIYFDDLYRY